MSDQVSMTSWSMVATVGGLTALLISGVSFVAAEPPASSPTVQNEKATPADSGDVKERGIRQMPLGGMTTGPMKDMDPVGFQCSAKTRTCSCRKSTPGDCDLMKAIACGGGFECPGSSQTCTCKALK